MAGYELNTTATVVVFAFDVVTGLGVTGQTGTNLKLFIKEKGGTVVEITDTAPTELSSTNAPGYYEFDLAAAEINTQYTHLFPRSTTTSPNNVGAVVVPPNFTVPVNFYQGTNPVTLTSTTETQIDDILVDTAALDTRLTSGRATLLDNLVGVPASPAGAAGGLATFDDVNAGVIFGSVDDTTPAAGSFTGNAGLSSINDFYNNRWLIFTSNALGARKISDYVGSTTKQFDFTGTPGTDADAPFDAAPTNGDTFIIFGFHGA